MMLLYGCGQPRNEADATSLSEKAPDYQLGTVVRFAADGNSGKYRDSGWNEAETQFTWTRGNTSTLKFVLPPKSDALVLRMRLAGLIKPPELPFQPVEVYANDKKIADWQVRETADFSATILANVLRPNGSLTITLRIPRASSPKNLGIGNDSRVLGVSCFEVQISNEKTG